ncbi:MAG: hypothetical protein WCX86_12545, partial [Candidatus Hydrogenedentales bacterium]
DPVPFLDESTGIVSVPSGTPTGSYTIEYTICEDVNPSNCDSATVTVQVVPEDKPDLSVTKTADLSKYSKVGDVITYTITVTNTGNVPLTNVLVSDPLTGLSSIIARLIPGASDMYTETYTITQSDVDAGSVVNTASAAGKDPQGKPVEDEDSFKTEFKEEGDVASAALDLVKTADVTEFTQVGDTIVYTVTVSNTGSVTLSDVRVQDPLTGLDEMVGTLAVGESKEFSGEYIVTQDDYDAGSVLNVAFASATSPEGDELATDDTVTVTAADDGCRSGFNFWDTAGIFVGILSLIALVVVSIFLGTGGGLPTK